MHTAAWCCGYPIDSSGLETGEAGTAVSTPSSHQCLQHHCLLLTPSPVPAGKSDIP